MPRSVPPNRVKELRERAGMQQKEVAIAVGITRPTVSEWENQKKNPSGERLERLVEIFGVPKSVILGYEPIPNPVPVLFIDDGNENASREIQQARELVARDPERGELFTLATTADIKTVRRALAILKALSDLEGKDV